ACGIPASARCVEARCHRDGECYPCTFGKTLTLFPLAVLRGAFYEERVWQLKITYYRKTTYPSRSCASAPATPQRASITWCPKASSRKEPITSNLPNANSFFSGLP